ncbi:uncharacterized protein [Macrobrachium rosenbergii]|uniref:uncharacterized protein isoform X2 n=1 Tax=Macrobrachium rosenbergii TaxID=79674 RepID=UPI0034D6AFDA
MIRKYLSRLFFLCGVCSLEVNNMGDGFTNSDINLDDGCNAERTVTKGTMMVKEYFVEEREEISQGVEQVVLYCKPDVGFQGIQTALRGMFDYSGKVNFTAEELRIFPDSRWYDVSVTLIYRGNYPQWGWYMKVSIKDGEEVEMYVKSTPIASRPTTIAIYSMGPSKWRFSRPAAHCYKQNRQNTDSTDEDKSLTSPEFILAIVFGVAFSMAVLISIVLACKIKHLRAAVPPQANPGAGSSGSVQTENAIYGYRRY